MASLLSRVNLPSIFCGHRKHMATFTWGSCQLRQQRQLSLLLLLLLVLQPAAGVSRGPQPLRLLSRVLRPITLYPGFRDLHGSPGRDKEEGWPKDAIKATASGTHGAEAPSLAPNEPDQKNVNQHLLPVAYNSVNIESQPSLPVYAGIPTPSDSSLPVRQSALTVPQRQWKHI